MAKLDHLTIYVSNYAVSRDWKASCLGLRVAFENLAAGVGGLEDDGGIELILEQSERAAAPHNVLTRARDCVLTFQCPSVHEAYQRLLAHGVAFTHSPMAVPWGFGAELADPDGYQVRLWDKATMPGYSDT